MIQRSMSILESSDLSKKRYTENSKIKRIKAIMKTNSLYIIGQKLILYNTEKMLF